ncbi:transposase [Leptolyngbya cf. ectocarpi LEGE 11479]|uniref:Transposase n=1 Tax=Leptolyngbya cf. ectocarpi LEGE 11479 TaxID=1828722 RepID=A0A928WZC1_LEPEC|nr:transposase [Leptolyngbya ectocarpi]MBE9066097.1 transposase [Leptolyngbya cf. ectocarpi LEGE 11479]
MAPRKLSDADKRDVLEIYRQPGETTSTIAKRYSVSTSTISRILKTQLPDEEYRALIAQKRSGPSEKPVISAPKLTDEKSKPEKPVRRVRTRSRTKDDARKSQDDGQLVLLNEEDTEEKVTEEKVTEEKAPIPPPRKRDNVSAVTESRTGSDEHRQDDIEDAELDDEDLDDELDEDLDDLDSELDDDFGDDDEDEDDEDDDDDDGDASESGLLGTAVEIMPLSDAVFPRTCYLVVDRLSELITHPLKEFAELGDVPAEQESALTLPVFDNHRVARRFSRRNQRVIKVPDGQLITKATSYLQAKGITHLLIDGNIYSLLG